MLEEGGVVEAVADALVQDEFHIDVLALDDASILLHFDGTALAAKCTEGREITEVVQVVVDGGDAQTAHGGQEDRAMEGAKLQQERG